MRRAVSVTLEHDNVLWLKAQAVASAKGTVSDVLDRLVTQARSAGSSEPNAIRSIAGTIDLPEDDLNLEQADAYLRGIFARSIARPMAARERPLTGSRKPSRRG